MNLQCPNCLRSHSHAALLEGGGDPKLCPACGAALPLPAASGTPGPAKAAPRGGGDAVPLPGATGNPLQAVDAGPAAAPPTGSQPADEGGWARPSAAPPVLGGEAKPEEAQAAARRARLREIVFDDFDLDEEAPQASEELILEAPAEFALEEEVEELPELALEAWEPAPAAAAEPPPPEPSALHFSIDEEPPPPAPTPPPPPAAPSAPAVPQAASAPASPPELSQAPPLLQGDEAPRAKGPSLGARLQALAASDRLEPLRERLEALPKRQKILAASGLALVFLVLGAFFVLEPAPPPAPPPPPPPPALAQKEAEKAPPKEEKGEAAAAKEKETGEEDPDEALAAAGGAAGEEAPAPPTPEEAAAQVAQLLAAGKGEEASTLLTAALEVAPEHPGLLLSKGQLLEGRGEGEEALAACAAAATKDPALLGAQLCLVRLHLDAAQQSEALASMRRALALAPDDEETQLLNARVLYAGNRLPDAKAAYERLLEKEELQAREEVLLALASLNLDLAQPHEIVRLLEGEVEQAAAAPALIEALGDAYAAMMQWAKAEELYRRVAKRPGVAYKAAKIELGRGRVRQALPLLQRAAREPGAQPEVFRDLGFCYKDEGKRQQAAQAFRSYLQKKEEAADRAEIEEEIAQLGRG